jgi:hypothetical protein
MFELAGIAALLFVGLAAFAVIAVLGLALKLLFKLVLLPFTLLGWLLKGLLLLLVAVLGLVLAPVFMVVLAVLAVIVAVPLLLLAGLASASWALA